MQDRKTELTACTTTALVHYRVNSLNTKVTSTKYTLYYFIKFYLISNTKITEKLANLMHSEKSLSVLHLGVMFQSENRTFSLHCQELLMFWVFAALFLQHAFQFRELFVSRKAYTEGEFPVQTSLADFKMISAAVFIISTTVIQPR